MHEIQQKDSRRLGEQLQVVLYIIVIRHRNQFDGDVDGNRMRKDKVKSTHDFARRHGTPRELRQAPSS